MRRRRHRDVRGHLSAPESAVIGDAAGKAAIVIEEGPFFVSVRDATEAEGDASTSNLTLSLALSAAPPVGQSVTVKWPPRTAPLARVTTTAGRAAPTQRHPRLGRVCRHLGHRHLERDLSEPTIATGTTPTTRRLQDQRSVGGTGNEDIISSMTSAGVVINPTGVLVSDAGFDEWLPALESNGSSFVVGQQMVAKIDVFGSRITVTGVVQDPERRPLLEWPERADRGQRRPAAYRCRWSSGRTRTQRCPKGPLRNADHGRRDGPRPRRDRHQHERADDETAGGHVGRHQLLRRVGGQSELLQRQLRWRVECTDLYGAWVATDGSVLDAGGLPVSTADVHQQDSGGGVRTARTTW